MRDFNRIILMGRLGQTPVRRQTKDGKSVVNFSLATSRWVRGEPEASVPDGQGGAPPPAAGQRPKGSEETDWHRIVVWGRQADVCVEYLDKGDSVLVEGGVRTRKYEGKDGTPRTSFEVHADLVRFLGGRSFRRATEGSATGGRVPSENVPVEGGGESALGTPATVETQGQPAVVGAA